MPDPESYDLNYRPRSYWGPQDLETHYGARAKGELRRETGLALLGEGIADEDILASSLPVDERDAVGALHPWFMGGEYLPDLLPNEVEIARVTLKSTTMDVKSIRARQTKHRIVYRIVDEYGDFEYQISPKTGKKPLTLRQLIDMIDNGEEGGMVGSGRDYHFEEAGSDPEEIYNFETASSAFYEELAAWYDAANEEWRKAKLREIAETPLSPERMIKTWVRRAKFPQPEVREMLEAAGFAAAATLQLVEIYAQSYLEKAGCLPVGQHEVNDMIVEFPENIEAE